MARATGIEEKVEVEKRKVHRLRLRLPIEVRGFTRQGLQVEEQGWTIDINNHGVKMISSNDWEVGSEVKLQVLVVVNGSSTLPMSWMRTIGKVVRINGTIPGDISPRAGHEVVINFQTVPRLCSTAWD